MFPVPRVPAVPAMPDADVLDELLPGAGGPVRAARAAHRDTVAAVVALEAGRPGGSDWVVARDADRAAVLAGRAATELAALISGDAQRYATALALCSTLSERGRAEPPAGLGEAARQAALALHEPMRTVTLALSRALAEKRLSDAHRAREQGLVVTAALAERQAVARWAGGEPFEVRAAELPVELAEGWLDCCDEIDGIPVAEGWRARHVQRMRVQKFNARVSGSPSPAVL